MYHGSDDDDKFGVFESMDQQIALSEQTREIEYMEINLPIEEGAESYEEEGTFEDVNAQEEAPVHMEFGEDFEVNKDDYFVNMFFWLYAYESFGLHPSTTVAAAMDEGLQRDGKEPMDDDDNDGDDGDVDDEPDGSAIDWTEDWAQEIFRTIYSSEVHNPNQRSFQQGMHKSEEIHFCNAVFQFGAASAKYPMEIATADKPYTHYAGVENELSCQVNFLPGTILTCLDYFVAFRSLDPSAVVEAAALKWKREARPNPVVGTTAIVEINSAMGFIKVDRVRVRHLVEALPKSYAIFHQKISSNARPPTGLYRAVFLFVLQQAEGLPFHLIVESPACLIQGKKTKPKDIE
eukprot:TRINITY_DN30550_c0_g1_i1.p1 TRINITY_DN30550_c0_g1~~TRINITY_DN30550_c0_g1_i1.p1  ORF type:complete len:348 (+),score=97.62 TRINITY_DN30550_c0_g1_i1:71-1114(+)